MATSQDDPDSQSAQHLQAKRINIRSETYACSSDRTTIEEMADHVISRCVLKNIFRLTIKLFLLV